MYIGPIGPGGYELNISLITPKMVYLIGVAPLSWVLGVLISRGPDVVMLQIGPFKVQVQKAKWIESIADGP